MLLNKLDEEKEDVMKGIWKFHEKKEKELRLFNYRRKSCTNSFLGGENLFE
jgi:hypothetical protein